MIARFALYSACLIASVSSAARAQLAIDDRLVAEPPQPPSLPGTVSSIDLDGDTLVMGLADANRVLIYERTFAGWQFQEEILPPAGAIPNAEVISFGNVSLSGNTLAVAATGTTFDLGAVTQQECCDQGGIYSQATGECDLVYAGAVFIFERIGSAWLFTQALTAPTVAGREGFGGGARYKALRLQGDRLIVNQTESWDGCGIIAGGQAHTYRRSGGLWSLDQTLVLPNTQRFDGFGIIDSRGDTAVGVFDTTPEAPSAVPGIRLYREVGNQWSFETELTVPGGNLDKGLGPVAVGDSYLALGAPSEDGNGQNTTIGAVYLYQRNAANTWEYLDKLQPRDLNAGDRFGSYLAFQGDTLLVTANPDDTAVDGAVYVFERAGADFIQTSRIAPNDGNLLDEFGQITALSGGRAAMLSSGSAVYTYGCGPDSDGDGLCDDWETIGVPYLDSNGDIQRYLLDINNDGISDADPATLDLFVELDVMTNVPFGIDEEADLAFAFLNAPVQSPQGIDGINLHLDVQHDVFPFTDTVDSADGWPDNEIVRERRAFGTFEEQTADDAEALLNAKAKAFRYGVAFNDVAIPSVGGYSIGGQAELPGDDFVVYFANFITPKARAATFMHELGHTLGLGHGGGDHINGKPNYPSIMNYTLADKMLWNEDFWQLDFSREALAPLDEFALNEQIPFGAGGSGYYNDWYMPYSTLVPDGSPCFPETQWNTLTRRYAFLATDGSNDLNANCVDTDLAANVDLNYLTQGELPDANEDPSPNQVLVGHNDWENLRFAVSDGGGAFRGALPPDGEPSNDLIDFVRTTFEPPADPCPADTNGDGILDNGDIGTFVSLFLAGNLAADFNGDGILDNGDIGAFVAAFLAGC